MKKKIAKQISVTYHVQCDRCVNLDGAVEVTKENRDG